MCQYRYYYFAGCQHQQTALFGFCDSAIALSTSVHRHNTPADSGTPPAAAACQEDTRVDVSCGDGAPADPAPDSPTPSTTSSTQHTTSSSISTSSSAPTSFASILESASDTASVRDQPHIFRHHSEAHPVAMASFAQLGFKHWITGGATKPAHLANPVMTTTNHDACGELTRPLSEQARSLRARRDGLRERTDESCNMPDSGELLRHIAESCRGNSQVQRIGTDGGRAPSYMTDLFDSSVRDQPDKASETYDAIESDIDRLKEEISKMRATVNRTKSSPVIENEARAEDDLLMVDTQSMIPSLPTEVRESAAARLQKAHEQANHYSHPLSPQHKDFAAPPPNPFDFPELNNSSSDRATKYVSSEQGSRKPSYRDIATAGITNSLVAATSDAFQAGREIDDSSVVISSTSARAGNGISDSSVCSKSSPKSRSKQSPRFAQPTKSFARRTDATLRKDTAPSSPDGLSRKSPHTGTQRQQKRKSLPHGWVDDAGYDKSIDAAAVKDEKAISSIETKASPAHITQDKATSYMSPTKATTQRNIATLGEETVKRLSPKAQKGLARIDTSVSLSKDSDPADPGVINSAGTAFSSESVEIVTERRPTQSTCNRSLQLTAEKANVDPAKHCAATGINPTTASQQPVSQVHNCSTMDSSVADILAARAHAAGIPTVPNTTPKRRGSHGHILAPIRHRLAKVGLLRGEDHTPLDSQARSPTMALHVVRETLPETPSKLMISVFGSAPAAAIAPHPKCVPPHLRRKQNSSFENTSTSIPLSSPPRFPVPATVTGTTQSRSAFLQSTSRTGSLNAAAKEFKPMLQPLTFDEQLQTSNLDAVTAFRSEDEWYNLSPEQKRIIIAIRDHKFGDSRNCAPDAAVSALSPSESTSKATNQRYWSGVAAQQQTAYAAPQMQGQDVFNNNTPSRVQAGQVLKHHVDPNTGVLQWVMQDVDGKQLPLKFGRAAPPVLKLPGRMNISPDSSIASPCHMPSSWTIGNAKPNAGVYRWSGGDGREIKFSGWGPDAERDPNTPVNLAFQGRKASSGRGPRMIGADEDDDSPPLAPRSRRQWAERLGYSKVPCGQVDITHAVEFPVAMHPFSRELAGYCFDRSCSASMC